MATGVLSEDVHNARYELCAVAFFGLALAVWVVLVVVSVLARALWDRGRLLADARTAGSLTGVAATAVLGVCTLDAGWMRLSQASLAAAAVAWLALFPLVLRHLPRRTAGTSFLLVVSAEALAVLAAAVAGGTAAEWLWNCAAAAFAVGLLSYGLVVSRFRWNELLRGRGDQWVAGGALSIAALAAATLASAASPSGAGAAAVTMRLLTIVVELAALCWLPVLIACEQWSVRLGGDVRRWATVFPVGMYGAGAYAAGGVLHAPSVMAAADAWSWVALATWLAVFGGSLKLSVTAR